MAKNLSTLRILFPKTLIFCQTIAKCCLAYETIINNTGGFTEPPGSPDYHKFRLIDMYCRSSSCDAMNKKVLKSFMMPGGKLRMVIATTAFIMGIDCPDICNIIHYFPPTSIEQYVQETGRAERDGFSSTALLLFRKPTKHMKQSMVDYCTNTTECRRKVLFKHFLFYEDIRLPKCKCCDNKFCETTCDCNDFVLI